MRTDSSAAASSTGPTVVDGVGTDLSAGIGITAGQRGDGVRPPEVCSGRTVQGPSHSVPAASYPQVRGGTEVRPDAVHDPLRTDRPPLKGDGTKGGIQEKNPNTVLRAAEAPTTEEAGDE
ncbi:hypothetical protein GCM10022294_08950 [Dietzia aurantiaca]